MLARRRGAARGRKTSVRAFFPARWQKAKRCVSEVRKLQNRYHPAFFQLAGTFKERDSTEEAEESFESLGIPCKVAGGMVGSSWNDVADDSSDLIRHESLEVFLLQEALLKPFPCKSRGGCNVHSCKNRWKTSKTQNLPVHFCFSSMRGFAVRTNEM